MPETLIIHRRFHGPPGSANGGYACGVIGTLVGGDAECTLRAPPPLDAPLEVVREPGRVLLRHQGAVVGEGVPTTVDVAVPPPVSFDVATAAARAYVGFSQHPFPSCFVCGPQRDQGDGLRLFPGAVPGAGRVAAAPWVPDASLADDAGLVRGEILWAALDCPSWFGLAAFAPAQGLALLGRLAVAVHRRPAAGERCVALGWWLGDEGRKIHCGSALVDDGGAVLARARATWIRLAPRG